MQPFILSLVVFMSVAISGCTKHADAPDPLGVMPSLSGTATRSYRIYHINDFHGFAEPGTRPGATLQQGGAAWLATALNRHRAEQPGLFLAAGDMIQGDTWSNFSQGYSAIALLNEMRLDAMVTGNHEFDFGQEVLKQRISEAHFPVLAANVIGLPGLVPQVSLPLSGGKVTVIGLVSEDVPQSSHPRNTTGLKFITPLAAARQQIAARDQDSDLVVLLTHIGHEQDLALAEKLCTGPEALSLPILIVGGHSHTRVEAPERMGNCAVVQAGEHGKFLGVVDVSVGKGKMLAISGYLEEIGPSSGAPDPAISALIARYSAQVDVILNQKAGVSKVDLIQEGARMQETNLGNLVADIVRKTTGSQVALINGGSLRTGLSKGEITYRQVHAALPFNNYLVAVKMSGELLWQALEHGVSGVERGEGRFPQVSGMAFVFDSRRPVGQRIISVTVGGHPLDRQQEYTVATLDFIASGGDGYTSFGEAIRSGGDYSEVGGAMRSSRLVYNDPGQFLRDAVLEALATGSPVAPVVQGRIVEQR
jgi:2',3'-cyclic-nucleotide 2'-phosphodiesterase (5'-nucleotidase family)